MGSSKVTRAPQGSCYASKVHNESTRYSANEAQKQRNEYLYCRLSIRIQITTVYGDLQSMCALSIQALSQQSSSGIKQASNSTPFLLRHRPILPSHFPAHSPTPPSVSAQQRGRDQLGYHFWLQHSYCS